MTSKKNLSIGGFCGDQSFDPKKNLIVGGFGGIGWTPKYVWGPKVRVLAGMAEGVLSPKMNNCVRQRR